MEKHCDARQRVQQKVRSSLPPQPWPHDFPALGNVAGQRLPAVWAYLRV